MHITATHHRFLLSLSLFVCGAQVQQYENFLNEKLRSDLRTVLEKRDAVHTDIAEYTQLAAVIGTVASAAPKLEDGCLQTQVDLGCSFFCQAEVSEADRVRTFRLFNAYSSRAYSIHAMTSVVHRFSFVGQ
jgi:hypothetical protein